MLAHGILVVSPVPQLYSVSQHLFYVKNMIYHCLSYHFLIICYADPVRKIALKYKYSSVVVSLDAKIRTKLNKYVDEEEVTLT